MAGWATPFFSSLFGAFLGPAGVAAGGAIGDFYDTANTEEEQREAERVKSEESEAAAREGAREGMMGHFSGGMEGISAPTSAQEQRIAAHERLQKVREVEKADEVSRRLRAGRFRLTSSGSQKKDWRDS